MNRVYEISESIKKHTKLLAYILFVPSAARKENAGKI